MVEKWELESACLSAIFGESVNSQVNQGDNFFINVFPRRVELRNLEHGRYYGYGSVIDVPDRHCPGHVNKYQSPLDGIYGQSVPVSKRGIIGGFSKKSSVNMKKTIEDNLDDLRIFWTGTYPDEIFEGMTFEERVEFERHHFDLFKRRAIYHGWFGFWRKEFVSRKSGELRGEVLPHYHGLLGKLGLSENLYVLTTFELCKMWVDCMGIKDPEVYMKAIKVSLNYSERGAKGNSFEYLDSKAAVSRYLSKYMSKADQQLIPEGVSIGRSWGRVGQVKQAVPVEIRLTKQQMIRFCRVCRGLYRSTAKKVRKKYLSSYRVSSFVFMLAKNTEACLKYLKGVSFDHPIEQTFADVPF